MEIAVYIAMFFTSVVLHEISHGLVAYYFGDKTAKEAGRLSLNPLRHIDPVLTLILPGLLFFSTHGRFAIGMAKPVPVNFNRLHEPKHDMVLVALAGPLTNLFLAAALTGIWKFTGNEYALYAVYFNLGLAVFNMVPIPPLDGSRVLAGLLPANAAYYYLKLERIGFGIVLLLYFTGWLFYIIVPAVEMLCRAFGIPSPGINF